MWPDLAKSRTDLSVFNDNIESVFIEIDKDDIHYDKPVIVGVVYRPPGFDMTTFNEEMNVILSEINNTNKYFMGDFNVNLLNVDSHIPTVELSEMLFSHYCMPLINKPTRVKSGSSSLIIYFQIQCLIMHINVSCLLI